MRSRRDRFEGLRSSKRSLTWMDDQGDSAYKERVSRTREVGGMYGRMLAEDLSHLFPYDSGPTDGFTAVLDPSSEDVEELILDALPTYHGPARTLHDGLREFGQLAAQELLDGPVVLEIDIYTDESGDAKAFRLDFIPNPTYWESFGRPRQWVPAPAGGKRRGGLHYRELDASRVVKFDLGRRTRRDIRRALKALSLADSLQSAAFGMVTSTGSAEGFDFETQRSLVAAETRKRTHAIGWDGRGLYTEGMLEPYPVWRRLRFARFQGVVRAVVVEGIQEAIDRAGKTLGFQARIVLDGLLSDTDLDEAERALQDGSRSLVDLTRLAYGRRTGD